MEISLIPAWSLYENGKLEAAQRKFQEAIDKHPDRAEAHLGLGKTLRDRGKPDKAVESFKRAIEIQPEWLVPYGDWADLLQRQGKQEDAIAILTKVLIRHGTLSRELIEQGLLNKAVFKAHQSNKVKLLETRYEKNTVGVFFASQPKSGTGYILDSLRKGLGVAFMGFDNILNPVIGEQILNSYVISSHAQANRLNLLLLNIYVERFIVNIRDPRPAALSALHYLNKYYRNFPDYYILHTNNGSIVKNYLELDFKTQLDYMIEIRIPNIVKWICDWLEAEVSLDFYPIIIFTRHEDLAKDSHTFFKSILDFYEIDFSLFTMPQPPEPGKSNFRKGSVNEWREVFTLEQREKATSLIPQNLFDRFEWEK